MEANAANQQRRQNAIKLRNDKITRELLLAMLMLMGLWVGVSFALAGINQIPTCRFGERECFFYVQICTDEHSPGFGVPGSPGANIPRCLWMPKMARVEGSNNDSSEKLAVATVAVVLGLMPGVGMMIAQLIQNERTLFTLLETSKYAIALDLIMLVIGSMDMDRLTWDCRWYNTFWNPDHERCRSGYQHYIMGVTMLFVLQACLLLHNVVFTEIERKRVGMNTSEQPRNNNRLGSHPGTNPPGSVDGPNANLIPNEPGISTELRPMRTSTSSRSVAPGGSSLQDDGASLGPGAPRELSSRTAFESEPPQSGNMRGHEGIPEEDMPDTNSQDTTGFNSSKPSGLTSSLQRGTFAPSQPPEPPPEEEDDIPSCEAQSPPSSLGDAVRSRGLPLASGSSLGLSNRGINGGLNSGGGLPPLLGGGLGGGLPPPRPPLGGLPPPQPPLGQLSGAPSRPLGGLPPLGGKKVTEL